MSLYPVEWLKKYAPTDKNGSEVLKTLAKIGLEEDELIKYNIKGQVVVGQIKSFTSEKHSNGKTINWCQVDVGAKNGGIKGIVCGANNFKNGDFVAVALANTVLPNNFEILARKTYGHISDGMICSYKELGLNIESDGIIVLKDKNIKVGDNAIELLSLNDDIIGLNITPDRGYCFSVRGVARELAGALGEKFIDPVNDISGIGNKESKENAESGIKAKNDFKIEIKDKEKCDKFIALTVNNCNASSESPYFIQKRIDESGMRPINLAVDATNYVMLELGQPLHAYDKDTLAEPIIVRNAKQSEKIKTLDGQIRELNIDDLLITDKKRLLGIAGVMGGFETEITKNTKNILIEAAHFNPQTVAKSARLHKLPSEASKRFERGVDYKIQQNAALKVANILIKYGGGTIGSLSEVDYTKEDNVIDFDYSLCQKITSVEIAEKTQKKILEIIGCQIDNNKITIPSWRPDLNIPEDLVEEIVRINGYEKIPSKLPVINQIDNNSDELFEKKILIEQMLSSNGLTGVLSYPFVSDDIFNQFGIENNAIELENPLDQNAPFLRTSILQTLYKTVLTNFSRGISKNENDFGIFEVSNLAFKNINNNTKINDWKSGNNKIQKIISTVPKQELYIAGIIINTELKKIITLSNDIFKILGTQFEIKQSANMPFHPGKCGEYITNNQKVGSTGMLHPTVLKKLHLPNDTYAFELNLSKIFEFSKKIDAKPISTWPIAKTDLAFVIDTKIPASKLIATISQTQNVENVQIFDIYQGENMPKGKKSIAFSLNFRADNKTLKTDDINELRNEIIKNVLKLGGTLRDF